MSWLTVQLRRLADSRAATGGLIGLALVTSFLFAIAPRVIDTQADVALRSTVDAATSGTRNIAVSQTGRIAAASPDPLAAISTDGDQFFEQFPGSAAALVQARYTTIDTARFLPLGLEGRTVRLRYLQGATDHISLVSGRLPTGQTTQLPFSSGSLPGGPTLLPGSQPLPESLTTFEVALSTASAHDLGVGVGDTLQLSSDKTDTLVGPLVSYLAIDVVGIYDVPNGTADYWFGDTSLERPQVRSLSSLNQIDDVTVLFSAAAYPALLSATTHSGLRYTWRYEIDSLRLRADSAGVLLTDLRRMESVFLASGASSGSLLHDPEHVQLSAPALQSGLRLLVQTYAADWRAVSQMLSLAEVGGGAVALLALSLVCLLAGRRRALSLSLWQSRGASRLHAMAGTLVEVALELAVPVVLGAALAIVLIPSRPLMPTLALAGGILVFASGLVLANTWAASADPAAGGRGGWAGGLGNRADVRNAEGGRGLAAVTRGASPRRLALEAMVIIGAVVGAFILRQRGVTAAGADVVLTSPDPLVAAVPALIGGAAALVVARLLPIPLDLLARLAERRRGLVAMLALRRATGRANDRLLLTALLTMAAVWSFAAVSLAYLGRASEAAGWQSVGASFRVTLQEGSVPPDLDFAKLAGVEATSDASVFGAHVPETNESLTVMALDLAAYRDVTAGGWLAGVVPESMIGSEAPTPTVAVTPGLTLNPAARARASVLSSAPPGGTASQVTASPDPTPPPAPSAPAAPTTPAPALPTSIPAIVSTTFAADMNLRLGDTFQVALPDARPSFTVAAIRATFPTLDAGTAWIVAARQNLAAATPEGAMPATEVFVRADPAAGPTIAKALQDRLPAQGYVASRFDVSDGLRDAPDYVAVVFGLAAASLVTAAYGALAIFLALLLAGAEQSRESAHLRILGLSRGENLALSAIEHGPASLLVSAAGVALGAGLFAFLQSGLGLGGLVGGDIDVGLPIETVWVAAIFVAIGVIVALAVVIETVAESIISPTAALRKGIE